MYKFISTLKIVPELQSSVEGKYNIFAYSKDGSFHTGYNDLYFVATKKSSGNYIKNFSLSLVPQMTMGAMNNMQHSTPVSDSIQSFNDSYLAVKRGWISFLMNSTEQNTWSLSYNAQVLGTEAELKDVSISVSSLASDQSWVKSFSIGDDTYYISLVNPTDWTIGTNAIRAYVSKKSSTLTEPYHLANDSFTIDIYPEMPDMGGHTSPDNVGLTRQTDGSYEGTVNITMTGLWRIHLTVRDDSGNVVAGGDTAKDGLSSLYFDVTL